MLTYMYCHPDWPVRHGHQNRTEFRDREAVVRDSGACFVNTRMCSVTGGHVLCLQSCFQFRDHKALFRDTGTVLKAEFGDFVAVFRDQKTKFRDIGVEFRDITIRVVFRDQKAEFHDIGAVFRDQKTAFRDI